MCDNRISTAICQGRHAAAAVGAAGLLRAVDVGAESESEVDIMTAALYALDSWLLLAPVLLRLLPRPAPPTSFHRCLAVHMHYAAPRSALE